MRWCRSIESDGDEWLPRPVVVAPRTEQTNATLAVTAHRQQGHSVGVLVDVTCDAPTDHPDPGHGKRTFEERLLRSITQAEQQPLDAAPASRVSDVVADDPQAVRGSDFT